MTRFPRLLNALLCASLCLTSMACDKPPAAKPTSEAPVAQPAPDAPATPATPTAKVVDTDAQWEATKKELAGLVGEPIIFRVTRDAVSMDGKKIVGLTQGVVDPSLKPGGAQSFTVKPVQEAAEASYKVLQQKKAKQPDSLNTAPRTFVFVDADVPTATFSSVLFSLSQGQLMLNRVAVARPDGGVDVFKLSPASLNIGPPSDEWLKEVGVSVVTTPKGFTVLHGKLNEREENPESTNVQTVAIPLKAGSDMTKALDAYNKASDKTQRMAALAAMEQAYDTRALYAQLLKVKALYPDLEIIQYSAIRELPVDMVAMLARVGRFKRKGAFTDDASFAAAARPQTVVDSCQPVDGESICLFPYAVYNY